MEESSIAIWVSRFEYLMRWQHLTCADEQVYVYKAHQAMVGRRARAFVVVWFRWWWALVALMAGMVGLVDCLRWW